MSAERYEVVIVGGGPAGLSTALHLLARRPELASGLLLLERGRYPRPKTCAGMLAGRGWRLLERAGVRLDVPVRAVDRLVISFQCGSVEVREPDLGWIVRREQLDHALARALVRRGLQIREGARVAALQPAGQGSHPVELRLADGGGLRCRVAVGADGAASVVRRDAGLDRAADRARSIEVITGPGRDDPPEGAIHFDFRQRDLVGYAWDFPAPEPGRFSRGVYALRPAPGELRRRLRLHLRRQGLEPQVVRPRQLAQRPFDPAAPLSRPHLLLVGEAAGIDPVTGEGLPQALAYGVLAGPYLATALDRGELGFADWLAQVRGSSLGRRLRARRSSGLLFHGPRRAEMEQLIQASPAILKLWAQDFAGQPLSASALARGTGQLLPRLPRHGGTLLRALAALVAPE